MTSAARAGAVRPPTVRAAMIKARPCLCIAPPPAGALAFGFRHTILLQSDDRCDPQVVGCYEIGRDEMNCGAQHVSLTRSATNLGSTQSYAIERGIGGDTPRIDIAL